MRAKEREENFANFLNSQKRRMVFKKKKQKSFFIDLKKQFLLRKKEQKYDTEIKTTNSLKKPTNLLIWVLILTDFSSYVYCYLAVLYHSGLICKQLLSQTWLGNTTLTISMAHLSHKRYTRSLLHAEEMYWCESFFIFPIFF